MTNSDETTDVVGPAADLDAGGLVAPATAPLPGSLEHPDVEVVAPTETIMAPADTIADAPAPAQAPFVLDDPGILPAPDPDTWVDEPAPIDPQRWTLGEVASLTGRFVSVFWAMTVMWLVVFSFLPLVVGWTPTVVSTGSMAPAVSAGTVVHVDSGVDPQILGPGSIITFEDPRFAGRSVTHRVIEPIRDTTTGPIIGFRTKGDANAAEDSEIVPVAAVDGAVRLVLPYAGLPQVWLDDGRWWIVAFLLLGTLIAAVVAFDTLGGFITGRTMFRRRSVASAVAIAIAVMLGGPASNAAFAASTDTTGTFAMTGDWYLDAIDADAPVAHWRLDDTVTGGGSSSTVLVEDFESPVVFTQFGTGQVAASTTQARSGTTSAHKTTNNDPNGASLPLPVVVTDSFTFEVWVYRPSSFSGGSIDRLGIEDATFGGYTFNADHNGNSLRIDRRDGGNATGIGVAVTFNPPEDEWYRLRLQRDGASLSLAAYDTTGALLAATSANDGTYTSFDRMTIRGGHDYFVDDVTVTQDPTTTLTAIDRIGTEDGVIDGIPTGGAPSLLQNLPGSASAFDLVGSAAVLIGDDALINTTDRDERTVELWFEADSISGRQVLYEEGGTVNGLSVYLDGGQLYGRAWSQSTSWSNALTATSSPGAITPGQRYHVAVVLDAAIGRDLELHLNGTVVDTATKTDANTWNRHTDDGAIGRVNGGTQFHDGNSSAASYFDGVVDEVVLFNTALDADRVEAHWFAGR